MFLSFVGLFLFPWISFSFISFDVNSSLLMPILWIKTTTHIQKQNKYVQSSFDMTTGFF